MWPSMRRRAAPVRSGWYLLVLAVQLLPVLVTAAVDQTVAERNMAAAIAAVESGPTAANQLFWGDTHLHTHLSIDANIFGNANLGPAEAYRFARGEVVAGNSGQPARLLQPLDFLAVTDHGEFLGLIPAIAAGDAALDGFERTSQWREVLASADIKGLMTLWAKGPETQGDRIFAGPDFASGVWRDYARTADTFNAPGQFTALIGYEWTGMRGMDNLHRNVLFADDAETVAGIRPFTSVNSQSPEDLWTFLEDYEAGTGGRVLAIPHNSNLSGGRMFRPENSSGEAMSAEYARRRARWEPLVEITQVKGDSETHPQLSPQDEFAEFGRWDTNLSMSEDVVKSLEEYPFDYVRSALKTGLHLKDQLGVNPFEFGVVGSTDSHTSLSTSDADNFWGKFGKDEPHSGRAMEPVVPRAVANSDTIYKNWRLLSSGLAGVWAQENTRRAIFDALRRKEVYATTGPRIVLRFFGGWDFKVEDVDQPDFAQIGYSRGVPMGGTLRNIGSREAGPAPSFLVSALRDPQGANLDRLQVVKGWVESDGSQREVVYDVLWSDDRQADPSGRIPAVGNTINMQAASYENTIGRQALAGVWQDPDFDPQVPAFYYLRVLEIPTPRWPLYDSARYKSPLPDGVELIAQQRAYTSPIWYNPR